MAKKKKKTKEEEPPEEVPLETILAPEEPEVEEVQYTDTSYTSASFESLPPEPVVVDEPKKKKKKKKTEEEEIVKTSDVFNWSEESLPPLEDSSTDKPVVTETQKAEPKKKKGKKGKEPKEKIPDFEKPKNWKSMDKKQRDKWLATKIEEWRAEEEAKKQEALAGAKEKKARLARERAEKMFNDCIEQDIRSDILDKTCILFSNYERQKYDYENKQQEKEEWQQYLRCDGLPDPRIVTQMNTFLHLWQERATYDAEELNSKCLEVLPMLEMLEVFVANARQYTPRQAANYNEVRLALRSQLQLAIDLASYYLLRDIEKRLVMENIKLATYGREFTGLKLTLWVSVKMPTRKPKPVEPDPEPKDLEFPAIRVTVKLPKTIDCSSISVRASRSMIDLLSEKCRTFPLAVEKPNRYLDLYTFTIKEHAEMLKIKKEQDEIRTNFYKEARERIKALEALLKANVFAQLHKEREELDNLNLAEPPPMLDPREQIGVDNEKVFKKYLKQCRYRTKTGEINLRKYRICSGVLNLDLLTTPPQPKRMRYEVEITTLELPNELKAIDYKVQYRAPAPPAGVIRTPEEIEAEMKKIEMQYQKLALVCIELPPEVMWSEPPVICQWHEVRKMWTSLYVNDYKFNEDKLTVQFRTGVLWPIGIATLKHSNMPYQGWDIRPDPKSKGVLLTVIGVCVTVTWLCHGKTVRLKHIANASTPALKENFNVKYSVKRMVQIMREASCDFFPDFDGHNCVEGTCPKEWVIERHNYHAMAFLSRAYNFKWSRWNATAGQRNIIMQVREAVDTKRQAKFQLLHVTPLRASILGCNELVSEFNMEPVIGLPFYPDLFTMNMSYGSVDARRATFDMKYKLVECVFEMLQELKLSSFS